MLPHRVHVYQNLVGITAAVEPCIKWMISGVSVKQITLENIVVSVIK